MIHYKEGKGNQDLIFGELINFFNKFKKASATDEEVATLANKVSYALDLMDYNYREIKALDRKAFMDLMKVYYDTLVDQKSKILFSKVFSI